MYWIAINSELPTIKETSGEEIQFDPLQSLDISQATNEQVYITTHGHVKKLCKVEPQFADAYQQVPVEQSDAYKNLPGFPKNVSFASCESIEDLQALYRCGAELGIDHGADNNAVVRLIIMNGMGFGLGDNVSGLAVIDALSAMLLPEIKLEITLLQRLPRRLNQIYRRTPHIVRRQLPISLTDFMSYDAYVDMDGLLGHAEFDYLAMVDFLAKMVSVDKLMSDQDKLAKVPVSQYKTNLARQAVSKDNSEQRDILLLHHTASTPLRSLPADKTKELICYFVEQGYYVITPQDIEFNHEHFANVSATSRTVDDLLHILSGSDVIITVDTVTLHLAASLQKPTVLLPTTESGLMHTEYMPTVVTCLNKAQREFVQRIHKAPSQAALDRSAEIWNLLTVEDCGEALNKAIDITRAMA